MHATLKSVTTPVNGLLAARARRIEEWVERSFLDPHGIVYSYLDTKTGGPLTDASFGPDQSPMHLPGTEAYTPAEWHNYENCGMTTGAYTQAMLYRYAVERDPAALAQARRGVGALTYAYDIGKQLEEGFFPRIYGNRFSEQTSTDQVLYATLALDHFHQFATDAEKAQVSRMIVRMVGFWMKRDYKYTYFWHKDMQWPLGRFTCLLLMAYRHGGGEVFKVEYDRLLAMGVNEGPVEGQLAQKRGGACPPMPYEVKHHAWLIGELEGASAMEVMELDYLLRNDPANAWSAAWKRSIVEIMDEARLVLAPDGTAYVHVLVDMDTGEPRRPEPEYFRESNGPDDWIGFSLAAGARTGDSTLIARAAVQAEAHAPRPENRDAARLIVGSLDKERLRSYLDPERYPVEMRHRTERYTGDGTANWLWAYWQGRAQGLFGADE